MSLDLSDVVVFEALFRQAVIDEFEEELKNYPVILWHYGLIVSSLLNLLRFVLLTFWSNGIKL